MRRLDGSTRQDTYEYITAKGEHITLIIGVDGVTEEDVRVLRALDREGWNRDRAETRRHISLDKLGLLMALDKTDLLRCDVDDPAGHTEARAVVSDMLRLLSSEQQGLLLMLTSGWSVPDVAREQGVSPSAIWHRLRHIRQRIKNNKESFE